MASGKISSFTAVGIASGYLLLYALSILFNFPFGFIEWLFFLSPLFVIGMVIIVLNDDYESMRTFDEYFYQDKDIRRNAA
jgi:hypothetical protein